MITQFVLSLSFSSAFCREVQYPSYLYIYKIILLSGGILVTSNISFHCNFDVQSALVVGSNRILDILYRPNANQTKLRKMYKSLAVDMSTFCNCPNVDSILKMLVNGDSIAILVMLIENMLSCEPDIYIINAFIITCCPGRIAIDIAWLFCFAIKAFFCVWDSVAFVEPAKP